MYRLRNILAAGAVLVTLVGAINIGDDLTEWIALVASYGGRLQEPIAELLFAAWGLVFTASLLFTAALVVYVFWVVFRALSRGWPSVRLGLKGALGMDEFLKRSEALEVIEMSEFYRSRLPESKESKSIGNNIFQSLGSYRSMLSDRDVMVRQNFTTRLLRAFEEQRPDGKVEDGYVREELEAWLSELFDEEVKDEMGPIPRV